MLAGLLLTAFLSGLTALVSAGGVSVCLRAGKSCVCGRRFDLTVEVTRTSPFFLGGLELDLISRSVVSGTEEQQHVFLKFGGGTLNLFRVPVDTKMCGEKNFRVREVFLYDALRLFRIPLTGQEAETDLIIYPYSLDLGITLQSVLDRYQSGDHYDPYRRGEDVSEVHDLRDYAAGDPLQAIHWKLSAKSDKLIVREFGHPVNYQLILMYDLYPGAGERAGRDAEYRSAILSLVSSISQGLLRQGVPHYVGVQIDGEQKCLLVDSEETFADMLRRLMHYPAGRDTEENVLSFLRQNLYERFSRVVYVTGFYEEGLLAQIGGLVGLTVIETSDEENSGTQEIGKGMLISLSMDKLRETRQTLYI